MNSNTLKSVDYSVLNLEFTDIFELEYIQRLLKAFSDANAVSSVITDINGNFITQPYNYRIVCKDIIRKSPNGLAACERIEKKLSSIQNNEPIINQCDICGLWEAGVNIKVGGKHIGNWIIGQIQTENQTSDQIKKISENIGIEIEKLSTAMLAVPVMTLDRFKSIADMLYIFVNELSDKAYSSIELKRNLIEKEKLTTILSTTNIKYQTILQTAIEGFWLVDTQGKILEVNDAYCTMSGYTKKELLTMTINELDLIESINETKDRIKKIIEDGKDSFETIHKRKDGSHFNVELNVKYHEIDGGIFVVFLQDVTQKKAIEKSNIESKAFLNTMIELAPDPVFHCDKKGNFLLTNEKTGELTEYSKDELLNMNIKELFSDSEINKTPLRIDLLEKGEIVTTEREILTRNGKTIIVEINSRFMPDGTCQSTLRDISEHKRMLEALSESEQYLKETQEISQLGTFNVDLVGQWWTSSEIHDTIYGIPSTFDRTLNGWLSLIHLDWQKPMIEYFKDVLSKQKQYNIEYKIVRQNDQQERWVHCIANIKYNKNKQPIELVGTIRDITESKFAQKVLLESEKQLERAEKVAKIGNWKLNLLTNYVYSSEGARIIYGVDKNGSSLEEVQDFVLPQYRTMLSNALSDLINHDKPYNVEFKICRKIDGKIIDIHSIAELDREKNMLFGVVYDITERKLAEETIKNTKILLEKTIEQSPVPMILVSMPNAEIQIINKASIEFFGAYDESLYLNKSLYELNPSWKDYDKYGNESLLKDLPIIRSLSGEMIYNEEHSILREDGTLCYELVSSYPIYDDLGNIFAAYLIIIDITERKKVEFALKESREKFIKIFDRAPVLIAISTIEDGTYLDVNRYSLDFLGYNREDVINYKYTEIAWLDSDSITQLVKNITQFGRIDGLELPFIKKDGTKVWGLVNGEIIIIENQKCLLTITTDITERKRIESLLKVKNEEFEIQNEEYLQLNEELTQTNEELYYAKEKAEESDRLKLAFLANMSHEIRTPMNGILGFTELLKAPDLTSDTRQTYIEIIEKSGARMLNIINDIISISKVESGQMEIFITETDINEQIDFIYSFFKLEIEQKGLQFTATKTLQGSDTILYTDKEKVYAVLTNLVKNAIKFTTAGSIDIGYEKKGLYIEFYVKDSGVGIPIEQTDIIFERFRQGSELLTRDYEGAGLGLSISKAYIEMLGGRIWLESVKGQGSTFYFSIPRTRDSHTFEEIYEDRIVENESVKSKISKGLTILVAEDDKSSEMLLTIALEPIANKVIVVRNGLDAVNVCKNIKGIDLVLMDHKMPVMDGYEATNQIRQFNKDIIIIAQTAYALPGDKEKALEAGCNDYISKPFNHKILNEMILKYFP